MENARSIENTRSIDWKLRLRRPGDLESLIALTVLPCAWWRGDATLLCAGRRTLCCCGGFGCCRGLCFLEDAFAPRCLLGCGRGRVVLEDALACRGHVGCSRGRDLLGDSSTPRGLGRHLLQQPHENVLRGRGAR